MYGAPAGESELHFYVNATANKLAFVHTCLGQYDLQLSYRLPITEKCPAVYAVRYADGATEFVHVRFGIDIGNIDMDFGRHIGYEGRTHEDNYALNTDPAKCPDPPLYWYNKPWKNSLLYSAHPFFTGGKCLYVMEWDNPRPDTEIERVFMINTVKEKDKQAVLFCAAAVK